MKLGKSIATGAALGILVPCVLVTRHLVTRELFGSFEAWLWPSSILLMALEGPRDTLSVWTVMGLSVFLNTVLYAGLAAAIHVLCSFINKARRL
ncbi:hypothetical protein [Pseudoxanthomonas sp. Root630]|uniref:hypothetical protein n=1 Tax=Pseudoxanthomonas sp. Root630 TaxID=1736574 RepID=UPI000702FE9E|nr:hypothetical protein [Pseudoxanthomonas sp. Root630]KRA41539.1 hypothetical protein ASD72_15825 [Pseudoxanthomonas sp. Root630]